MIPRNLLFSVAIMFLVSVAMGVYVWRTRSHGKLLVYRSALIPARRCC